MPLLLPHMQILQNIKESLMKDVYQKQNNEWQFIHGTVKLSERKYPVVNST